MIIDRGVGWGVWMWVYGWDIAVWDLDVKSRLVLAGPTLAIIPLHSGLTERLEGSSG